MDFLSKTEIKFYCSNRNTSNFFVTKPQFNELLFLQFNIHCDINKKNLLC